MNPSDNAVVLCVDEESQIQALERAQPLLPMDVAPPERQTGTTDLFAALASWLHQVERWFGRLTEHALRRGSHTSTHRLKSAQ
jgi:hypothetical protein